jgi:hypothetical protein
MGSAARVLVSRRATALQRLSTTLMDSTFSREILPKLVDGSRERREEVC